MANSHLNPVLLSAYLDDEVTASERILVESHLVTCETCQVELDGLRWTANLFHQLPEVPLPRNFYVTEAMLEESPAPIKKSWFQWLESLFDGMRTVPVGVGAAVMALLLLMVMVQPFSTVSEPEVAMAPLATAPLPDEEVSALALSPEEEALASDEDLAIEKASGEASAAAHDTQQEENNENDVLLSPQSEAVLVMPENDQHNVLTESEASFDPMLSVNEEANELELEPVAPAARPARPARGAAPTATIEAVEPIQQPLNTATLIATLTPDSSDALDTKRAEGNESADESAISPSPPPIASGPEAPTPLPSAPPAESEFLPTEADQAGQTTLIVIGMLLLLILAAIYWYRRSD